jgi:hypothetical protein
VAAIHIAAFFLLLMYQQEIAATIHQLHLNFTVEAYTEQYNSAVITPCMVHIVLSLIFLLILRSLYRKPTRAIRIRLTILLVIQILAHATIPITISTLPSQTVAVILVQSVSFIFELCALYFLWIPLASKAYFTNSTQ